MSIARLQFSRPEWLYDLMAIGVTPPVLAGKKVSCEKSITGKYVNIVGAGQEVVWTERADGFTQNNLLTSSANKMWRGRIKNHIEYKIIGEYFSRTGNYHFLGAVSASPGRDQVDSSQEGRQERSRNSSLMWSFGSCSRVTRPGWRVLLGSRGWASRSWFLKFQSKILKTICI